MVVRERMVKVMVGSLLVGAVVCSAALGVMLWGIHQSVEACCASAQASHPHSGDDVAALLDVMGDASAGFPERNRVVWTLGRLRAARALPALQAAYTGEPCMHEGQLCQHELAKAIERCGETAEPPETSER